jgi:hypothetical protein
MHYRVDIGLNKEMYSKICDGIETIYGKIR